MATLDYRFQVRGGLKAAMVALNEVPLRREMIVELDNLFTTGEFDAKIGDGTTHYNDLPYLQTGGSGGDDFAAATGTDTITATFATAPTLTDGQQFKVRAAGANTTTSPTFNPNSLGALTLYKLGGVALAAGDISGAGHELIIRYRASPARYELVNPAGVQTLIPGPGISVGLTDPDRPLVENIGVIDVIEGVNVSINKTNPRQPIISSTMGIVNLKTRVDHYANLPGFGNSSGDAILVDGPPKQIYIWNGTAWPAEGYGFAPGGGMSVPNYVDTVMADAPIAFWKLDDPSGTSAADSSGNGRNGVYMGGYDQGVVPVINLPGAAVFNGSDGHVDVAYGAWMNKTTISVECWAFVLARATDRVGYVTRKFGTSGSIPYSLETNADTGLTPQMAQYNGTTWTSAKSQASMPILQWVHLVGTRSATGVLNMYMNGAKANVANSTGITELTSTEGIFLGRQHNYLSQALYIAGALSCCAVYDKVLTPNQVSQHYAVGSVPRWLIGS